MWMKGPREHLAPKLTGVHRVPVENPGETGSCLSHYEVGCRTLYVLHRGRELTHHLIVSNQLVNLLLRLVEGARVLICVLLVVAFVLFRDDVDCGESAAKSVIDGAMRAHVAVRHRVVGAL